LRTITEFKGKMMKKKKEDISLKGRKREKKLTVMNEGTAGGKKVKRVVELKLMTRWRLDYGLLTYLR
jgi:hypothetical protein